MEKNSPIVWAGLGIATVGLGLFALGRRSVSNSSSTELPTIVSHEEFKTNKQAAAFFQGKHVLCLTVLAVPAAPDHVHIIVHLPQDTPTKLIKANAVLKDARIAKADAVRAVYPSMVPRFPLAGEQAQAGRRPTRWFVSASIIQQLQQGSNPEFVLPLEATESSLCSDLFSVLSLCCAARDAVVWLKPPAEKKGDKNNSTQSKKARKPEIEAAKSVRREEFTVQKGKPEALDLADNNGGLVEVTWVDDASRSQLERFRGLKQGANLSSKAADIVGGGKVVYSEGGSTLLLLLKSKHEVVDILLKHSQYIEHKAAIFASGKKCRVLVCHKSTLKTLLNFKTIGPGTILACATPPAAHLPLPATCRRLLVLDGLVNAENVGSMVRIAACFGVDGIILSKDCHTCWNRRAIRVSMGHVFHIPTYHCQEDNLDDVIAQYREQDQLETYAAVVQGENKWLHDIVPTPAGSVGPKGFLLVMGSEHFGISEKVRRACAAQLKIKMAPDVDSLNVSVATAVLLHHLSTTIV